MDQFIQYVTGQPTVEGASYKALIMGFFVLCFVFESLVDMIVPLARIGGEK